MMRYFAQSHACFTEPLIVRHHAKKSKLTPLRWLLRTAVLVTFVACDDGQEVQREPLLRTVRHVVVASQSGASEHTFSGALRAGTESRLGFQVSGRVKDVWVKVGQRVKKGEKIAALDPTDFELQLQEARASQAQAQAQATSAKATYERVRKLYANNNASRQDLDNARAQRDGATSLVSAGSQAVRRLHRQLGYARLTAPAAGSISQVAIESGEVVAAGQVAAVLQVGEQLDVAVDVPEAEVTRIEQGDKVKVRIDVLKGEILAGTVSEIGVPKQGSTVFPVTVHLDDARSDVRAGMAAEVTFAYTAAAKSGPKHVLPATAVGEDRDGRFIFLLADVKSGEGMVKRRPVEVGEIDKNGLEILRGVKDGDKVVTAGVSRIHDGLRVRVAKGEPPQAKVQAAGSASAAAEASAAPKPRGPAQVPAKEAN